MKIAFTGGGTAGHAVLNMAIISRLREVGTGDSFIYIGSRQGMERKLARKAGIPYKVVAVGKLRRYISFRNLVDVARVGIGFVQAFWILRKEKPNVLVSGGGFASVPAALAAACLGVPLIARETELTPGLANRIILPLATEVHLTFPCASLPSRFLDKAFCPGLTCRPDAMSGLLKVGPRKAGLPVVLVMGGSSGSSSINRAVIDAASELLLHYRVLHITGKRGPRGSGAPKGAVFDGGYRRFEYVDDIAPLYDIADVVISRAGSNAVAELMALGKPSVLVPLEQGKTQVDNARMMEREQSAIVLLDSELCPSSLMRAIRDARSLPERRAVAKHEMEARIDECIERIKGAGNR